MQTREGSEWNQAYQEATNKLLADYRQAGQRAVATAQDAVQRNPQEVEARSTAPARRPRKFDLHFGPDAARRRTAATIPVWIRDGWEVEEKTVLSDARAAGDSAAVVYGFIPQKQAEELKQAIASYYAATRPRPGKGTPTTRDEGIEARKAMETRQEQAQRTRDSFINEMLNDTAIYLAGGDQVDGMFLGDKVAGRRQVVPRPALSRIPSRPTRPTGTRSSSGPRRATAMRWRQSATRATPKPPGLQGGHRLRRQRQEGDRRPQALRQPTLRLAPGRHRRRPDRAAQRRPAAGPQRRRADRQGETRPEEHRHDRVPGRDITLTKVQFIEISRAVQEGRA